MQQLYFSCASGFSGSKKALYALLLFLGFLLPQTVHAQTTIFSEDFESSSANSLLPNIGWNEYETLSGNSRWGIGTAPCVISGSKSLFVVRNTIANSCDYAPASASNKIAYITFPTTNYDNLTLSFKWICNGEKIGSTFYDYGKVALSLDGVNWTNLTANYQGETTMQQVIDLALPVAANNKPTVYLGFRWINDGTTKQIPGFVIDDIVVKGTPMTPPAPAPVLTALSATEACAGASLTITGTDLSAATSVTIGGTAATITANTATSVTVTVGSGTTGNVVVTTAGGVSNGLPFTVKPVPVGTATPATATICEDATTSIALTSSVTGSTYTWTAASLSGAVATGFSDCTTGCGATIAQTLSLPGTASGVVRYTITPSAGGCTGTPFTADITVSPSTPVTATPASSTICSGTATSIALSTGLTGATFSWAAPTVTGGTVTGGSAGTGGNIAQTLTNTGTTPATVIYTITGTNPGGCTTAPITAFVTVNPAPVVTATPATANICNGDTTDIALTSTMTGTAYTWTASLLSGGTVTGFSGCTTGCAPAIEQTLLNAAATPGIVRYTINATAGGCSAAPVNVDVTVNPNPALTVSPASSVICSGVSTDIDLATGIPGATYAWATPVMTGGTVTGAVADTGNNIGQVLVNAGSTPVTVTYTIIATNPGGCSPAPFTASVIVDPGATITTQPASHTQCGGDYTFSVTATNAVSYQWYGPGGIIPGATSSTYTITGATSASSGGYYVIITGPAGCPAVTSTVATLLVSNPASVVIQPVGKQACEGSPFSLSVAGNNTIAYQWFKNGTPIPGATAATYTVPAATPTSAGSYYVKLIASPPCPSVNSNSVMVTVSPVGTWYGLTNDWNDSTNWCGGIPTATTNVVLPATGSVPFDAHIKNSNLGVANNATLENASLTVDNGGTLQLFGNLNLNPGGNFVADGGTLRLSGTADQQLQPGFTVGTFIVEGGGNKHLNKDVKINTLLALGNGKVMLNGNILRLSPGANIYGVSPTSYVVTNGTGGGMQQVIGTPEYIYPVGRSNYNPVYMSNKGTKDSILVKVREEVLENGNSGAPLNPTASTVILRTWDISESLPGGSDVTITLQWNAGEENSPAFTYEHSYIAQYKDGAWMNTCCTDADSADVSVGTGPFTRTKAGITELTHFTVASAGGEFPLLVSGAPGNGPDMQAFPNPAHDLLTVLITNPGTQGRIILLDMTGRELNAQSAISGKVSFDLRALAQGIYFVKYTDGQHTRTLKVSKQ